VCHLTPRIFVLKGHLERGKRKQEKRRRKKEKRKKKKRYRVFASSRAV